MRVGSGTGDMDSGFRMPGNRFPDALDVWIIRFLRNSQNREVLVSWRKRFSGKSLFYNRKRTNRPDQNDRKDREKISCFDKNDTGHCFYELNSCFTWKMQFPIFFIITSFHKEIMFWPNMQDALISTRRPLALGQSSPNFSTPKAPGLRHPSPNLSELSPALRPQVLPPKKLVVGSWELIAHLQDDWMAGWLEHVLDDWMNGW